MRDTTHLYQVDPNPQEAREIHMTSNVLLTSHVFPYISNYHIAITESTLLLFQLPDLST